MIHIAKEIYRKTVSTLFPHKEYQEYKGSIIPTPDKRWCGQSYKDNDYYIKSAEAEADRLISELNCSKESNILDVGCGQGRLPIGLLRRLGKSNYLGLDISKRSIDWCKRHLSERHPFLKFNYLNVYNERYNKQGVKLDGNFKFEIEAKSVDIIYLYSVFSHTDENDFKVYLSEFKRILKESGKVFFTTFVEKNVPDISINPDNYHGSDIKTPLLVVRYNKDYIFSILQDNGFEVIKFSHRSEDKGQSAIYLKVN